MYKQILFKKLNKKLKSTVSSYKFDKNVKYDLKINLDLTNRFDSFKVSESFKIITKRGQI